METLIREAHQIERLGRDCHDPGQAKDRFVSLRKTLFDDVGVDNVIGCLRREYFGADGAGHAFHVRLLNRKLLCDFGCGFETMTWRRVRALSKRKKKEQYAYQQCRGYLHDD